MFGWAVSTDSCASKEHWVVAVAVFSKRACLEDAAVALEEVCQSARGTEEIVGANVGVGCRFAPRLLQAALFRWAALSPWALWGEGQQSKAVWTLRLVGSKELETLASSGVKVWLACCCMLRIRRRPCCSCRACLRQTVWPSPTVCKKVVEALRGSRECIVRCLQRLIRAEQTLF